MVRATMLLSIAASLLAVSSSMASIPPGGVADYVKVAGGELMGVKIPADNVRYFRGVPYAASTAGANRWRSPQPVEPWTGTFDATTYGPGCVQTHHNPDVPKNQSEDCLNMNIYTPANAGSELLPIMIFWHGGAFDEGSNQGPFDMYDGSYVASNGTVCVITANYRLGALGYLVAAGLEGNFGFQDQRASLEFVQANLKQFGCDPNQVTIWGESAGAMSVGAHLASPKSKGLFHKAIMESDVSGFRYHDLKTAGELGLVFCQLLQCASGPNNDTCSLDCMRAADADAVRSAWSHAPNDILVWIEMNIEHVLDGLAMGFSPVVGTDEIPLEPMEAVKQGKLASTVPLLFGTNKNEGATFVYAGVKFALPEFLFPLAMDAVFGIDVSKKVVDYYNTNRGPFKDARNSIGQVVTDYWFRCASQKFGAASHAAGSKVFVYRFTHKSTFAWIFPKFGLPEVCVNDTCHASELPYVFHSTHLNGVNVTFAPNEVALSQSFVDYWTSFVKYGDPNMNNGQEQWPEWNPSTRMGMVLDTPLGQESATKVCGEFWDQFGYQF